MEQAKGKRGGLRSTSWKPGCPSPNPGGRPRAALAASAAVRELVDPKEWVAFELSIATDAKQPAAVRAQAWHALIDRGFVKPPTTTDLRLGDADAELDLEAVVPQLRALLGDEMLGKVLALLEQAGAPSDGEDPS